MTISEKIFDLLQKRGMSQKEFSERTGIAQSAISDWKRKKTNPVSEKILTICEVLEVTPEELLSGVANKNGRSKESEFIVISKKSELGVFVKSYSDLTKEMQDRVRGYVDALYELEKEQGIGKNKAAK